MVGLKRMDRPSRGAGDFGELTVDGEFGLEMDERPRNSDLSRPLSEHPSCLPMIDIAKIVDGRNTKLMTVLLIDAVVHHTSQPHPIQRTGETKPKNMICLISLFVLTQTRSEVLRRMVVLEHLEEIIHAILIVFTRAAFILKRLPYADRWESQTATFSCRFHLIRSRRCL
jgi:hypothetical protein